MTRRIAVIGHHLSAVSELADRLGQACKVEVYRDQNDAMYDLLKTDAQKYFSAYHIHVMLNRLMHHEKNESCIICDTLFSDYGAVMAALETGMITKAEFEIYNTNQTEWAESIQSYDAVIYLKPSTLSFKPSYADDFSLKYVMRCYEHFKERLKKLQLQLKDRFLTIDEEGDNFDSAKQLAMSVFDVKHDEVTTQAPSAEKQSEHRSISVLNRLKEKMPYLAIADSKDQIRKLISEYQFGKELSVRLPCLYVDENDCITCLRIVMDAYGDESIECKEFQDVDDAIRFLSSGEQVI